MLCNIINVQLYVDNNSYSNKSVVSMKLLFMYFLPNEIYIIYIIYILYNDNLF